MRWQGQTTQQVDDAALPGLESLARIPGLVRSVTTPEFQGMTFHEVLAKSALNQVPSASAMPFDWSVNPYRGCSHACVYCLSPDTLILRADGRQQAIAELAVGDMIMGTRPGDTYRHYVPTPVLATWTTRKRAFRITLADGTEIVASGDHRFLSDRGWKYVTGAMSGPGRRPFLTTQNRLMGFGMTRPDEPGAPDARDYRLGYLAGMIRGDGMLFRATYDDGIRTRRIARFRLALVDVEALDRTRAYLALEGVQTLTRPFSSRTATRRPLTAIHTAKEAQVSLVERLTQLPAERSRLWHQGFLAGVFDAEGSYSRGILRISNKSPILLAAITDALDALELPHVLEPPRDNGVASVRLTGGLPVHQRFFAHARPAITRKLNLDGVAVKTVADLRVTSIEDLGEEIDMVDITTGTADFIANGVISHNCFARKTHEYLDLDSGSDFDSEIIVKTNVADVLRRELARPTWNRESVALGTNTDPYQRAEGRYGLMPGIISALAESGTPFSVLTKGTLLRRDLPLLAEAAASVPVSIAMSIAVFDDALQKTLEPGTPSAPARLATVRAAADAGFRPTVFLMPVLPHLTDSPAHLEDAVRRVKDAGAARVVFGALHLRPGAKEWFWAWLERERPDLLPLYRGLYPGMTSIVSAGYRRLLAEQVRPLLRRHGLAGGVEEEVETRATRPGPVRATGPAPGMLF